MARSISTNRLVKVLTEYEDQTPAEDEAGEYTAAAEETPAEEATEDTFEVPEDLSALSVEDLDALHATALEHFDNTLGDGTDLSDEDMDALSTLTDAIEALNAEQDSREKASVERAEKAAEMAGRIRPEGSDEESVEEEEAPAEAVAEEVPVEEETPTQDREPELVTASAPSTGPKRVNLASTRSRGRTPQRPAQRAEAGGTKSVMYSSDAPGIQDGEGIDFRQAAKALDRRLASMPQAQYQAANRRGSAMREQHSLAVIRKPYGEGQVIKNSDPEHVADVLARATDERNTPQNSLVASGGWCAPSEVLYDNLLEVESRDGLFSLPEVGVQRGGFQFTKGPQFSDIYSGTGFSYTEQQDIDGNYGVDGDGVGDGSEGTKPCYKVDCPPFEEARLEVAGLCITAGLLQARGYPEVIDRTLRGALVAHDHKMAARLINRVIAGSDAVTMPADQVGALSPVLSSIELQVEHFRYVHRIARSTTLEAVFPLWVHGAIRSDLSRRLGVDMISVPDARINAWFAERGVAPQFVYNYQDITGAAADFTAWPTEVKFLLYAAGTWVRGSGDIITLDSIYDSVNLGNNDFTALFTEEAWLVANMGLESREVTVPISASGATAGGVVIDHNGTAGTAA